MMHFLGSTVTWSYKQWSDKIAAHFEKYFYVQEKPTDGELRPDLIHRRGIVKDTHGATQPWADYQLRPNFPIALLVVGISARRRCLHFLIFCFCELTLNGVEFSFRLRNY